MLDSPFSAASSSHPQPSLDRWYWKLLPCLLTLCYAVYGNMPFCLEFGPNFSNYAKTIFPYFLVLMCKSLSQMLKHPMTSSERNFYYKARLPFTSLSLGKCDPQGSITPLGGRWTAQAVKSSDLWPALASQKLPPRFMEDEMLCKSIMNVLGLQEKGDASGLGTHASSVWLIWAP